jgi:hypothetical protein
LSSIFIELVRRITDMQARSLFKNTLAEVKFPCPAQTGHSIV